MARKKPKQLEGVTDPRVGTPQTLQQVAENVLADTRGSDPGVEIVAFDDPRELITVGPDAPEWAGKRAAKLGKVEGAIVRLRPPASATDEDVERVRGQYEAKKAARVTVLPRPRAELVPDAVASAARGKAYGAREAVLSLVSESNAKDGAALLALCEQVMGKVGL